MPAGFSLVFAARRGDFLNVWLSFQLPLASSTPE